MKMKSNIAVRKVVAQTIEVMDEKEKSEVLEWAERSMTIVSSRELSKSEKLLALREVKASKPILRLLLAVARLAKSKTWDNQSWARRLGISGLAIGAATFGTQAAGVAAMGTAIGVPLALITASGAVILGVIIDEIKKGQS